jgi:glycosyltransferase involved in cell wall biosynthesis
VKILLSFKPEIVYGFGYSGSIYGRLAGAIVGVPILIGRVQSERIPPSRVIYAERLLRRKTDTIISNSFAGKRTWTELFGYPPEKVAVVQNGFNFEEIIQFPEGFRPLRELIGLSDDEPLVGCIGSMSIFKNPLMFIDVATAVIDSGIKAHFVWIGDGPMRQEVERVVAERHLGGMVHLLGHQKDACWLARDFCIGILTSIIEGTPNVILEYMYCGLPIVATNVGDCSSLIEHEGTGFIVEKNDAAAMAVCIQRLMHDRSTARAMGNRGRERLQKGFSVEMMITNTVAVCEEVRKRKR